MRKLRRILFSLLMVVTAVAVVAGATQSVFSDQKSIPDNTFATGTLNLTLNHSAGKPFLVEAAYPGYQTDWEYMDIFNGPYPAVPGQLPFEAYLWLSQTAGDADLYNALEIDLYDSGWNSDCGDGDDVLIYSGLLSGITGSGSRTQTSDNDPNSGGPGNDDVMPGNSERVCQRVRLPESAGNDLQGKSATFTEWVDAEQNDD